MWSGIDYNDDMIFVLAGRFLIMGVKERMSFSLAGMFVGVLAVVMILASCSPGKEEALKAVSGGDVKTVVQFLKNGANSVDETDNYGNTLLSLSIRDKQQLVTKLLVERGADLSLANMGGMTPLHVAAAVDNQEAAALLIDSGVDPVQRNMKDRGKTALHYAAINGSLQVCDLLLSRGVDVDIRCSVKATPLSWAAYMGSLETVNYFIDKGADTTARDSFGDSILGAAKNGKKPEIIDYLKSIGLK